MAQPTGGYHRPVLLEQTLQALHIRPDGIYLDGTAGGGGHSHAIAERLTTGRLIALDQDPDAIAAAGARLQGWGSRRWTVFCWISAFPPTSWMRRSAVFPIITMPRWICG